MHRTRAETTKRIPIPRKGTKFVARPKGSLLRSVPVVIALRDMLGLAKTLKEVKEMIKEKQIKLNGREVKDYRDGIYLFNTLTADKSYVLTYAQNGRFTLKEDKSKERPAKIVGKKTLKKKKVQINFHDGTNSLSDKELPVGDTVYLDEKNKISKHVALEKGKDCMILSGKYIGNEGKIEKVSDKSVDVKITSSKETHTLDKSRIIVL